MRSYEMEFLISLAGTITIETSVLFALVKILFKREGKTIKNHLLFFTGIFASATTLPYVWFVLPLYIKDGILFILITELSVIAGEALIVYCILKLSIPKSITISLVCNICSFTAGQIIRAIL